MAAARCGHAFCQYQASANAVKGSKEEVIWCTLAVAQGLDEAEWRMGDIYRNGRGGVRKSWFSCSILQRKSALQDNPDAPFVPQLE
jgi:TPR repeat protein